MGKYRYIDHTADLALQIQGDTIDDLFYTAAMAWRDAVIEKSKVRKQERREIKIESDSLEECLVELVSELNYFLSADQWLFADLETLRIEEKNGKWSLTAMAAGEDLDQERHSIEVEIKAVTFHKMSIENVNGKFRTTMIFDT